jgi:ABC-type nitrate/sulfonate/bicarbonate transport system substrate-binding protein
MIVAAALTYFAASRTETETTADRPAGDDQRYGVRWNSPLSASAIGILFGIETGLFAREGLTITILDGITDALTAAAVAADDHTIGQVSAVGFLRARAAGLQVVAIASSYIANSVELYALQSTVIDTPGDMAGKSIAYNPDTDCGSIVDALIRRQNIPRAGLKISETPDPVSRLIQGDVNVIAGHWESEGQRLRASGAPFRTLSPDAFGVHTAGSVLIVSERMIAAHSNIPERFLAALFAAWNGAYTDYGRTADLTRLRIGDDGNPAPVAELMEGQRRYLRPLGTRMGELNMSRLREMQDLLLAQRSIQRSINLSAAANPLIVQEVYRQGLKSLDKRNRASEFAD